MRARDSDMARKSSFRSWADLDSFAKSSADLGLDLAPSEVSPKERLAAEAFVPAQPRRRSLPAEALAKEGLSLKPNHYGTIQVGGHHSIGDFPAH
jgi:hypothetical protein